MKKPNRDQARSTADVHPGSRPLFFCAAALRKAIEEAVLPAFTRETGVVVNAVFGPTNALLQRIGQGPLPAVFAGIAGSVEASPSSSAFHLPSGRPLVRSAIGVAVAADSGTPDISSVGQLIDVLLVTSRSVAYSRRGPSGIYFADLLKELGIGDEVNAPSTLIDEGPTAYALLDGRADVAIHQLSELMLVPQAKLVGPPAGRRAALH